MSMCVCVSVNMCACACACACLGGTEGELATGTSQPVPSSGVPRVRLLRGERRSPPELGSVGFQGEASTGLGGKQNGALSPETSCDGQGHTDDQSTRRDTSRRHTQSEDKRPSPARWLEVHVERPSGTPFLPFLRAPAPPLARGVPRWGAAVCLERPGPPLCLHDGPKAATPPATPGPAVLNPGSHSRRGGVSFFAASTWEIARRCFLRCPCSVFPLCPPSPSRGVCLWVGGDLTGLLETRPGNPAPGSVCLSRTDPAFR